MGLSWETEGHTDFAYFMLKMSIYFVFSPSFLNKFNGPPLKLIFLCCSFLTSSTLWFGVLRLLFKLKMLTFIVGGSCSLWNVDCWPSNLNYPFLLLLLLLLKYSIPLVDLRTIYFIFGIILNYSPTYIICFSICISTHVFYHLGPWSFHNSSIQYVAKRLGRINNKKRWHVGEIEN
jgi:hypothetical protein